jgi:hypothetical protein
MGRQLGWADFPVDQQAISSFSPSASWRTADCLAAGSKAEQHCSPKAGTLRKVMLEGPALKARFA